MCVARQVTGIGCKRLGEKPTLMWLPWCEHMDVRSGLNEACGQIRGRISHLQDVVIIIDNQKMRATLWSVAFGNESERKEFGNSYVAMIMV